MYTIVNFLLSAKPNSSKYISWREYNGNVYDKLKGKSCMSRDYPNHAHLKVEVQVQNLLNVLW